MDAFNLSGNIVDIHNRVIFHGQIEVIDGKIREISALPGHGDQYILPGFVDAHVHIESSMLVPAEFSRMATIHGTVATVSDPHEIANVLGIEGVHFMINNARQAALKILFGAPSCVPATAFETSGAKLGVEEIDALLAHPDIGYLAEMMNYPGVLHEDPEVMAKIERARSRGMVVDGHAPGLRGRDAARYYAAGISTDHECYTYEEGKEKATLGMKILIREGSAARNYEALHPLISEFPDQVMFCSDDKHPDDLLQGHINELVSRAVGDGHELFTVLRAASLHPVQHYGLEVGLLRTGDPADFIVVNDLTSFRINQTYIDGVLVAAEGKSMEAFLPVVPINNFVTALKKTGDFRLPFCCAGNKIRVIEAMDQSLITGESSLKVPNDGSLSLPSVEQDILKLAVVNRYANRPPAVALVRGFGLQGGAIASCVAHDSHNIIAVGVDDVSLTRAINLVIAMKGGIAVVDGTQEMQLPLPVAGLMATTDGETVAHAYAGLDQYVREVLKSPLAAPFMTLSFMGLLVIPSLKLSDRGLFDVQKFKLVPLLYS